MLFLVKLKGSGINCLLFTQKNAGGGVVYHTLLVVQSGVMQGNSVIPRLSGCNYSFASVTEKAKCNIARKVLPLPQCNVYDYITAHNIPQYTTSAALNYSD